MSKKVVTTQQDLRTLKINFTHKTYSSGGVSYSTQPQQLSTSNSELQKQIKPINDLLQLVKTTKFGQVYQNFNRSFSFSIPVVDDQDEVTILLRIYSYLHTIKNNRSINKHFASFIRNKKTIIKKIISFLKDGASGLSSFLQPKFVQGLFYYSRDPTVQNYNKLPDFLKDSIDKPSPTITKPTPRYQTIENPIKLRSPLTPFRLDCTQIGLIGDDDEKFGKYIECIKKNLSRDQQYETELQVFLKNRIQSIQSLYRLQDIQSDIDGIPGDDALKDNIKQTIRLKKRELEKNNRLFQEMNELGLLQYYLKYTPQTQLKNLSPQNQKKRRQVQEKKPKPQQLNWSQINKLFQDQQKGSQFHIKDQHIHQMKGLPINQKNQEEVKQFLQAVKKKIQQKQNKFSQKE